MNGKTEKFLNVCFGLVLLSFAFMMAVMGIQVMIGGVQ